MSEETRVVRGPTEEQRRVIDSWGEGIAVMAGAGSGKTFTLVEKVRSLLTMKPEARFAAVSFTEKSASDLRAKLTRLTLELQGKPLQGHVVTTIHGLCSSILREYPREAGFDGDEAMLSESEASALWMQALDVLFFEELPPEIEAAFQVMTDRESRTSLYSLLARVRDLQANGVLDRMGDASDLVVLARYCLERYDRLKRRRGALDFNDLEIGADRALRHDHVSADYRKRFDLIMVDEFQDTNPVQARILERLSRPGFSNLCVVGDPKQSIYRFRDADVSVFEDFCSKLPVRAALTKNFRSVPGVLDFCNEVCAPAFESSGMEYQPLTPGLEADAQVSAIESAEIRSPEDLCRLILGEIRKGVPLSDMALLLRTIRGGPERWLKALTAAGIPIAIESGGLLWSDPRARELAFFMKWWANPANEIAGLAFLRSPWIGVSEAKIEEWRSGGDPEMLHSFLRSNHPVARTLRPLRLNPGRVRPGELLLALLGNPGIEEELGVFVLALWHRAEELSGEGLDFQRVAERIATACEEGRRERAVPPARSAGQLRVMTIHGSKGLEFPHVILLDFPERALRAKPAPLLFWDRDRGAFLAGRDESGDRLKKDSVEEEWKKLESEKELAESKRVFYVALTRAQKRLLLLLPTTDDVKKRESIAKYREKLEDPTRVDFWRGWIERALSRWPKIDIPLSRSNEGASPGVGGLPNGAVSDREMNQGIAQAAASSFKTRRPRHSVSEWNLLSRCERSYEWTVIRPVVSTEEEEWAELIATEEARQASRELVQEGDRTTKKRLPKIPQSEIGTRVHRCLELQDEAGLRELEEILGSRFFQADPVIHWMRDSGWMREREGVRSWKELAFEVPVGSGSSQAVATQATLIGALDRLVRTEEGDYAILDFKVTGKSKTKAELLEAYSTQLNLYAWALEGLVPEASGRISARLVHISGGKVQEIEVVLGARRLEEFRAKSEEILSGRAGIPQPGALCAVCDHRERCPEGAAFLGKDSSSS